MHKITIEEIIQASRVLNSAVIQTPLQKDEGLSARYECDVYLKREDLQIVRSFKIRGAYYSMRSKTEDELKNGVVCASAGNHAQGVAYSCQALGVKGTIFMPATTPRQKIGQVQFFGGSQVEIVLTGDTFDDSYHAAVEFAEKEDALFIHPFDDPAVITGQGTVGFEMMQQMPENIDYVFASIGGGGLISGLGTYVKEVSPQTKLIGVEPEGAPAMYHALKEGGPVTLKSIDKFVDGAAVGRIGELTFQISRNLLDDVLLVPEGKACTTIVEMYNNNAIVVEPAGALPVAALDLYRDHIKGKTVVCIISGGNNDLDRLQEIKERSLVYEGLRHYFIVEFAQRAGALREFLDEVLGPNDDIIRFEYMKKNNRDNAPALVGIELKHREDYENLIQSLHDHGVSFIEINKDPQLFNLLI